MPTWGWLMIGVSNSAPRLPVLVSVNVPPPSSSGADLVGAGALGQIGDLAGDAAEVQVAGVVDHRHEQPAVGVDGDAQVLGVVVGDRLGVHVDRRVDHRVGLERLDGGHREERQEGQLDALAGLEVLLGRLAQPGDLGDVDLDHGGELGRGLQRLDHPGGDDLPHPRHRLDLAALGGRGGAAAWLRRRRRSRRLGRGRGSGCGLAVLLGGGQHVGLADAPAHAGALHACDRSTPCSPASLRTSGVT